MARARYQLTALRLANIRRAQRISARKRAANHRVNKKLRRNVLKIGTGVALGVALSKAQANQVYPKAKQRKI
jgi:hypothetical protein